MPVNHSHAAVMRSVGLGVLALAGTPTASLFAQPAVEARDSIVLEESSDDYLVYPGSIVPDGTAGYLVTDFRQPRVFLYSAEGRLVMRYGAGGEGPGEWEEAQIALPHGADHILVLSWKPFAAQRFERDGGRFVERFPLRGYVESATIDTDDLWISGAHYSPRSAVRRLTLGEDEAEPVVDLPEPYREGGPVGGMFNSLPFTKWADTLLVAFMPLPYLVMAHESGRELDRFEVPAVRRRETPADPEPVIMDHRQTGAYFSIFGLFPSTIGLHRRPDGSFLLVHADLAGEDPPLHTETLWVSVIDADRTRACPDGRVPLGPESRPVVGFEGDRLLVLEQVLGGGDAVTVLRRIAVDAEDCDWMPLRR